MTNWFRRVVMTGTIYAMVHLLYLSVEKDVAASAQIFSTLPWVIVVILMLPMDRLKPGFFRDALKVVNSVFDNRKEKDS